MLHAAVSNLISDIHTSRRRIVEKDKERTETLGDNHGRDVKDCVGELRNDSAPASLKTV